MASLAIEGAVGFDPLLMYRVERFREMGFLEGDAATLAVLTDDAGWPISTHWVEDRLAEGCSHKTLLRIVL